LALEDVLRREQVPEQVELAVLQRLAERRVRARDRVRVVPVQQPRVVVAVGVLDERAVLQPEHRRPLAHPGLQRLVARELREVVELPPDPEPRREPRTALAGLPLGEGGEHQHLVVAEEDGGVGTVARVPQGADPERAPVDEVADEDRPPAVGRIPLERLEQPLQVTVDVADDQDREIVAHSSPMGW
jgi:flagellar biogenesis protein FliO